MLYKQLDFIILTITLDPNFSCAICLEGQEILGYRQHSTFQSLYYLSTFNEMSAYELSKFKILIPGQLKVAKTLDT